MRDVLEKLAQGKDLDSEEMAAAMATIMDGNATPAQIGGLLMALRCKGETVEEIAASAGVMRQRAQKVEVSREYLIDTCGTGGDGKGTFNVSTACAFVAAAAGARVAKHGNRSVSSKSGSADVLEAAGLNLNLTPDQVAHCIDELGVGFLFAPHHHGATRHAVGPRKELAVRTMFNLLGPLTNPAEAPFQVMGVYSPAWVRPVCEVLQKLGSQHVMVVHSDDGMDEISIAAPTRVSELKDGQINDFHIAPEDFGIDRGNLDALVAADSRQSLAMIREALSGQAGPAFDIVALNSGAAIYVSGKADSLEQGVVRAQEIQRAGTAWSVLQDLAELTRSLAA